MEDVRDRFASQCLDFAFRIYASEMVMGRKPSEWTKDVHAHVLKDVLTRRALVSINVEGRLIAFDLTGASKIRNLRGDPSQ